MSGVGREATGKGRALTGHKRSSVLKAPNVPKIVQRVAPSLSAADRPPVDGSMATSCHVSDSSFRSRSNEFQVVSKAERQAARCQRAPGREEFAEHRVSAFAIQHLPGCKSRFRGCDDVCIEVPRHAVGRRAGRPTPPRRRVRVRSGATLVQHHVATAGIGHNLVFLEAALDVVVRRLSIQTQTPLRMS